MPYIFEYNAGIVAGIVCTVVVMILVLLLTLVCKKTKPRYEFLALTPKVLQRHQNGAANAAIAVPQGLIQFHQLEQQHQQCQQYLVPNFLSTGIDNGQIISILSVFSAQARD